MWKIFKRDPYWKSDRRKRKAEKRKMRARHSSWRRRERQANWRNFKKSVRDFMAHPFAKKELTRDQLEVKRFKLHMKRERRDERIKWIAKFKENPWKTLFSRNRQGLDKKELKLISRRLKQERKTLVRQRRAANRENFRNIISTPDLRKKFGFGFLYSTAYFLLAYMVIYVVYQLITIAVASSFNIPVIWYYYQLKFPLYTYSPLYTRPALVTIFAAGPIVSLMLAFVFLKLYFTENAVLKRFQMFYLWGFINGANMFFGAYIAGFFTRTEFIYTSEWIFLSNMFDIEEIIFSTISLTMMILIGRIVTPLFLLSSGSVTLIKPENRLFFIVFQVLFPWIAGMIILFLITLPNYYFPLILKTITPGLILIPSLFMYNSINFENIHKSGVIQHNYFRWSVIIAAVAILFFYRIILSFGWSVS